MRTMTVLALLIVFKTLYLLTPLALIWAVNTLTGLGIQYTFTNWLAAFVLTVGLKILLGWKVEVKRS